jgi:long-chain acyl-CoA synthetase
VGDAAASDVAALRSQVSPEDPIALLYTSGTTGPPRGVILSHHAELFECAAIDRESGLPDGLAVVSYLPLAHIAERLSIYYNLLWKHGHVYFCPDLTAVAAYVRRVRPVSFGGVPRVWEKLWSALSAGLDAAGPRRRRLAEAAIACGREVMRARQRGEPVHWRLRMRHAVLDRLVLAKIRAALGLDRARILTSGAAPLAVEVAESFAAIGLPILEAYGMTETSGIATISRPGALRIGTVGPPVAGMELRLAADGEVLLRGPINTSGYYRDPDATAELLDADGWLHTGDVGVLDEAGHLRIVDRKKELIITAGGKNVSPATVENTLKQHPLVGQALAVGDRRPYVVALVVLDAEVAPSWAARHGVLDTSLPALARDAIVRKEIQQAIDATNQHLSRPEQVKRFDILPAEWTPESGELTPTMKLKRRVIHDKYSGEIENLYTMAEE